MPIPWCHSAAIPSTLACARLTTSCRRRRLASHIGEVLGLEATAATALLDELIQYVTQRQFVYLHRWRKHDLVMWDNRCTMHRGRPYDDLRYVRDMHRATVSDVANTCEQAGVEVVLPERRAEQR